MSTLQMIVSGIGVLIALVAGAFGIGHSKGKAKAERVADEQKTKQIIEQTNAATKRQTETTKEAANVQDNVSRMSDRAVDDELRNEWLNK
ncbi:hypothetical protein KXR87_12960 [Yokenella regensburgei]|uniref:hypothetical protein n=1 Tax=Yokenella regensburgei TaxID=158877 RepID=UPI003F13ECA2